MSGFLDYLLQQWLRGEQAGPHCKLLLLVHLLRLLCLARCSVRCSVMACRRRGLGDRFAIEVEDKNKASNDEVEAKCKDDSEEDCAA